MILWGWFIRSQCTYRCAVLPDAPLGKTLSLSPMSLNAPTGAWCSLTVFILNVAFHFAKVSMHLQVRGAP